MTPAWLRALIAVVRPLLPAELCGQIEINVFMGGIRNVNVRQSFVDEDGVPGPPRKPLSRRGGPGEAPIPRRPAAPAS
jgi:hypothetical protein